MRRIVRLMITAGCSLLMAVALVQASAITAPVVIVVYNSADQTVEGASVVIQIESTRVEVQTGEGGRTSSLNLPPGSGSVTATLGTRQGSKRIKLIDGIPRTIRVDLNSSQ